MLRMAYPFNEEHRPEASSDCPENRVTAVRMGNPDNKRSLLHIMSPSHYIVCRSSNYIGYTYRQGLSVPIGRITCVKCIRKQLDRAYARVKDLSSKIRDLEVQRGDALSEVHDYSVRLNELELDRLLKREEAGGSVKEEVHGLP